jgi:hypothetical protein
VVAEVDAAVSETASDQQLDLFAGAGYRPDDDADHLSRIAGESLPPGSDPAVAVCSAAGEGAGAQRSPAPPAELSDEALLERIRRASIADCHVLAGEAARRRLPAEIPALKELCRRFKGFGLRQVIPEQAAALEGLALIGGTAAARTVERTIIDQVVQGPGLTAAVEAAARLRVRLSMQHTLALLSHPERRVRAAACRCARPSPEVALVLIELLGDLHTDVARAAACSLGRMGRSEARPILLRFLLQDPSAEVIEAAASLADEEFLILLGRVGRARPDLADAVLAALEETDAPRASAIAESVRRAHA